MKLRRQASTTRRDLDLLTIAPERRKDAAARAELLNGADVVILCLPDDAAREAVSLILRERMRQAGLNSSGYSGHSLRAGFATSAAMAGAASYKIRAQTGHASDAMLSRYIRDSDLFTGNAAGMVL